MTCIIGLEHEGKVWMGGDSAGTAGLSQRSRNDKKVFIRDGYIIGFCGSFRMGQLVQHKMVLPQHQQGDLSTFMVNEFIDSLRNSLKGDDLKPDILVGYKGKLFNVESDFQVGESNDGYDTMGSGSDLAMGAMHANKGNKDPRARIEEALYVSSLNNAGVRPPFTILSV